MVRSFPSGAVVDGRNARAVAATAVAGHVVRIHHAPLDGVLVLLMLLVLVVVELLLARLGVDGGTVGSSSPGHEQDISISRLLEAVLVGRVRLAVVVTQALEDVPVELRETVLEPGLLRGQEFPFLSRQQRENFRTMDSMDAMCGFVTFSKRILRSRARLTSSASVRI